MSDRHRHVRVVAPREGEVVERASGFATRDHSLGHNERLGWRSCVAHLSFTQHLVAGAAAPATRPTRDPAPT